MSQSEHIQINPYNKAEKIMSTRLYYLLGISLISLLLLTSIYLQLFEGIIPCPLCTLQRLTFGLLGILFLAGLFLYARKWGRLIIDSLLALSSILGIFLAGRQIWLQHVPSPNNECGVSLQYMAQVLPFNELIKKIFEGSAECSKQGWVFMHLNMAEWALVWFVLFLLFSLHLLLKEIKF